jgi:hypothetical protein
MEDGTIGSYPLMLRIRQMTGDSVFDRMDKSGIHQEGREECLEEDRYR